MELRQRSQLAPIAAPALLLILFITPKVCTAGQGSGGPAVTLSTSTLSFPSQLATTTSAAQSVTLTNSGSLPLTITSITLTGTFSETNTCPASPTTLTPGSNCAISVTFLAPNGGPATQPGFIVITDDASPSQQVISLSGMVADFSLSASPGSNTVSAGQGVSYKLAVTPSGGFNQAVTFACGALPTGASCSFSPNPVTSSNPVDSTLTVSTTAGSFILQGTSPEGRPPGGRAVRWIPWMLLLGLGVFAALRRNRPRLRVVCLALAGLLLIALAAPACGGGSSSGGSSGTPPGTYLVLVNATATSGSTTLTNPITVTLVVN